jgi:hypothetical protein
VKVGPRILGAYFGFPRAPRILGYLKHSIVIITNCISCTATSLVGLDTPRIAHVLGSLSEH